MRLTFKLNSAWRRELAPGDRRIWLFRAIALRLERGVKLGCTCEIFWKRVLAVLGVSLVALYLAAVTALYFWWDRVPGNRTTWTDVATGPVRPAHLRQTRGDSLIASALQRLRDHDAVEAYYGLRAGLARSPANAAGRVALAQLMLGSDPRGALTLLEGGLAHSPSDLELLRVLFGVYAMQQSRHRALETGGRLLSPAQTPALTAAAREWLNETRAALLLADGNNAAAEAVLADLPSQVDNPNSRRAARLRASVLAQLGHLDEARRVLAQAKDETADYFRVEAELAIASHDAAALESALTRMRAAAPGQPAPFVFAFTAWDRMKRLSLRDRVESEFFQFFGHRDDALQLFGAAAVNLGLPDAVRRAEQVAIAHGFSPFAFRVHLTELALRRGDIDEAFRRLREWERTIETLAPAQRYYPEFINRVTRASVAGGEHQSGSLLGHLGELRGRASVAMYELAAKVLARGQNFTGARDVVALGLRFYPFSDPLLATQPELVAAAEKQTAARPASAKVADVATPSVAIPPTAERALEQLDAALASEAFGTAGDLLRAIRTARPEWAEKAAGELARRDAELAVLSQEPTIARALVRNYLERPRSESDLLALAGLAGRLLSRGRAAEARLLHDEIAVTRPSDAVAAALQRLELGDDLAVRTANAAAALTEIDRALRQGRADEALRLLDYVRQKSPDWLGEVRAELGAAEVRTRLALDQRPRAMLALKEIVIRAGASRSVAFKLVRQMIADGRADAALLLAREIVRLLPDDKAAATLLREAEAPVPSGS